MTTAIAHPRMQTTLGSDFDYESLRIPQSDDARKLFEAVCKATKHFLAPVLAQENDLSHRFQELAKTWRRESQYTSSVHEMSMHPAYQRIIGMGPVAIPFLLKELQRRPDHWFWALNAITGVDPVPESDRGNLPKMASAWVNWGISNKKL